MFQKRKKRVVHRRKEGKRFTALQVVTQPDPGQDDYHSANYLAASTLVAHGMGSWLYGGQYRGGVSWWTHPHNSHSVTVCPHSGQIRDMPDRNHR